MSIIIMIGGAAAIECAFDGAKWIKKHTKRLAGKARDQYRLAMNDLDRRCRYDKSRRWG